MGTTYDNADDRQSEDRRYLPRADAVRREADRADRELLTAKDQAAGHVKDNTRLYALVVAAVFVIGLTAVKSANTYLAPLLNNPARISAAAGALANGTNYLTYDLNIETRQLKHEMIAGMDRAPEVAVLGASHWQEGHGYLAPGIDYFNAHVHRDYYEDILGVTEMFVRYGKLPKKMIITIRDNQFVPVSYRTDFLWVPGLDDYRAMAKRLGLEPHDAYIYGLTPQLRQLFSLPLLKDNIDRYIASPEEPGPTDMKVHPALDVLFPDGSIQWSDNHNAAFTQERSRQLSLSFAEQRRNDPPRIDAEGVKQVDALLGFLVDKGVEVYLAHPPFNPVYWDALQGAPYMTGIRKVEEITKAYAAKYGLKIIGGFDPHKLGCTEEMYIDGEHSRPECLVRIINQFIEHDTELRGSLR